LRFGSHEISQLETFPNIILALQDGKEEKNRFVLNAETGDLGFDWFSSTLLLHRSREAIFFGFFHCEQTLQK